MNILVVNNNEAEIKAAMTALNKKEPTWECAAAINVREAVIMAKGTMPDIVIIDIDLPDASGFQLAGALTKVSPKINVIFVTDNPAYALKAHAFFPSAFFLKPVSEEQFYLALDHLRFPPTKSAKSRLKMRCFGNFDAFVDNQPITFKRSKTKELLAFLVDRNGARVTSEELVNALWEDGISSVSRRAQVRNLISDLRVTLDGLGVGDVVVRGRDALAILPEMVECDYYRYLEDDPAAVNAFHGEYMAQYWWSENTLAALEGYA